MKKLLLSLILLPSLLVFGQQYDDPTSDIGFRREVIAALEEIIGKVDDLDGPTLKNVILQALERYSQEVLNWDINVVNDIHAMSDALGWSITHDRSLLTYLEDQQWDQLNQFFDELKKELKSIGGGSAAGAEDAANFYRELKEILDGIGSSINAGVTVDVHPFPVEAQQAVEGTNQSLSDMTDAIFEDTDDGDGDGHGSTFSWTTGAYGVPNAAADGDVTYTTVKAGGNNFYHCTLRAIRALAEQLESISSVNAAIFNRMDGIGAGGSQYIKDDDKYRFLFHSNYLPSDDYNQAKVSRDIQVNENNYYYCVAQTLKGLAQQNEDSQSIQLAILGFLKNTLDGGQDKSEQEASSLQAIGDGYRKETLTEAIDSSGWAEKLKPPTILSQNGFESALADFQPDANIPTSLVLDFGVWGDGDSQRAIAFYIDLAPYTDLLEKCRSCTSTMLWFLLVFLAYWVFTRFIRVVWALAMKFLDISKV